MGLAVELGQAVDNHRPGREVHSESERFCGVHDLQEASSKQLLRHLFERRNQSGVVGRHPPPKAVTPGPHAEGCQVRLGQVGQTVVHQGVDGSLLGGVIQLDPITDHDVAGLVAPGPAEDEVDGWEHVVAGQLSQDLVPAR